MTPDSSKRMTDACHALAEHILRKPARTNRCKWLREQVAKFVSSEHFIDSCAARYDAEYPYADAPTPYLADILRSYDEEVA